MTRRLLLIGGIGICLTALFMTAAQAYTFKSGGTYWCHYKLWYDLAGGQKPGTVTTFLASDIHVLDGALVCKNPGTNRLDVRMGKGGLTLFVYSGQESFQFDERGRITANQTLPADVDYITNWEDHECYEDASCAQLAFEELWGVSVEDCRNSNWLPFQYLMTTFYQTGTVLNSCEGYCLDGGDGCEPFVYQCYDKETYEPCFCNDGIDDANCVCINENGDEIKDPPMICNCTVDDDLDLWCGTDEQYTTWAADGEVNYYCVEKGTPIAFKDYYGVGKNKTLTVNAPGVLMNDTDLEGDSLSVKKVNGSEENVGKLISTDHGSVTVYADGGFTYKPAKDYVGEDSFVYQATDDGTKISNEAKVTITVK